MEYTGFSCRLYRKYFCKDTGRYSRTFKNYRSGTAPAEDCNRESLSVSGGRKASADP